MAHSPRLERAHHALIEIPNHKTPHCRPLPAAKVIAMRSTWMRELGKPAYLAGTR